MGSRSSTQYCPNQGERVKVKKVGGERKSSKRGKDRTSITTAREDAVAVIGQ